MPHGHGFVFATLGAEEDVSRLRFCFDGLTAKSNRSRYYPATAPWTFVAVNPQRQQAIDAAIAEVDAGAAGQFLRLHRTLTEGGPGPSRSRIRGRRWS